MLYSEDMDLAIKCKSKAEADRLIELIDEKGFVGQETIDIRAENSLFFIQKGR